MKGRESQIWFNKQTSERNLLLSHLLFSGVAHRDYRDKRAIIGFFPEFNDSVSQCKQRVVFANANIFTRVMLCAALTHDDVSSNATLTAKDFDAQPFRF
jgi:hypothetical protein